MASPAEAAGARPVPLVVTASSCQWSGGGGGGNNGGGGGGGRGSAPIAVFAVAVHDGPILCVVCVCVLLVEEQRQRKACNAIVI
jgi:hypothetical protein